MTEQTATLETTLSAYQALFGDLIGCLFSRLLRRKSLFWTLICRLLRGLFAAYCSKPDLCCRLLRQTCCRLQNISPGQNIARPAPVLSSCSAVAQ